MSISSYHNTILHQALLVSKKKKNTKSIKKENAALHNKNEVYLL
jgi:hypothetical protein